MIKNILFDFDGVILDSMPVRDYGFEKIFEEFDKVLVDKLLDYHNKNGGLSRYVKIKYFYNELLNQEISEAEINRYADNFSTLMKKELTDKKYLIAETVKFIKDNYKKYNLHVVSGSDGEELRYLCKALKIDDYFLSINGSPTHKNELVKNVLAANQYSANETILIGDSVNDYDAAEANGLNFYGYNNPALIDKSKKYLENYVELL
jgi:HAD superfamily hydrolase (TIGR01549 family)